MTKYWNYQVDYTDKHWNYHYTTINHENYISNQIYYDVDKDEIRNYLYEETIQLSDLKNDCSLINSLMNRKSNPESLNSNSTINKSDIHDFIKYSFIGSDKHRAYPSGGGLYDVKLSVFINPAIEYESTANLACIDCDKSLLKFYAKKSWNQIAEAFIQKNLIHESKMVIVMSCDLYRITRKYKDIAYKLIMLEAGHIAQNIQLYCTYKKWNSLPVKGFYDIKLNSLLPESQSALYAVLIG